MRTPPCGSSRKFRIESGFSSGLVFADEMLVMRATRNAAPKRRHPRFPVRAPALLELVHARGRKIVRGQLSDVSEAGMGIRAELPEDVAKPGVEVTIRFYSDGRNFTVPADVVWAREGADDHATLGVRLALKRARPEAREAFKAWTKSVAQARRTPGALPAREQVECRLAALVGELDALLTLLADGEDLDDDALREVDVSAERLQNAITALELRANR